MFTEEIESIEETHLSKVFLTARYAFKLKKIVNFGFVDYSTFERRLGAANAELELNRRLTQGVYLGLLFLNQQHSPCAWSAICRGFSAPGANEALVVMRRLAHANLLSNMLNKVDIETHLKPLARKLRSFHDGHGVPNIDPHKFSTTILAAMHDNILALEDSTRGLTELELHLLLERSRKFVNATDQHSLLARAPTNIVDGHGDLRLEHVCIEHDQIQIIDCLEFSADLRTIDALCDLAFLLMDFDYNGRPDFGIEILRAYTGEVPEKLLQIYRHYRAMVRAKVHALRALQVTDDLRAKEWALCQNYISLASRYALNLSSPLLIVVCGLMGTGKSSLASQLTLSIYAKRINSDEVRKEIFQVPAKPTSQDDFEAGLYSKQATLKTYTEMFIRAGSELEHRNPVILDATFGEKNFRAEAKTLAHKYGAPLIIIECKLNHDLNMQRLAARLKDPKRVSDARPELLHESKLKWQEIDPSECDQHICVDTAKDLPALEQQILDKLPR